VSNSGSGGGSNTQATGVTPDYTASNGQIAVLLPGPVDDGVDEGGAANPSGESTSVTVGPDDGAADEDASLVVTLTAPAPAETSSVNSAAATAKSTQVEPTNVNAAVRVLSPGDNGEVAQTNESAAVAGAGAEGGVATAEPEAAATQVAPHNINVSVRVGSPGDDAPVTQVNNTTATAAPVDPAAIEEATVDLPTSGSSSGADVQNISGIVQDIAQCPEESTCAVAATPEADSAAGATGVAPDQSTATATQEAPSNVSVSVRVASPGEDGTVAQLNNADAEGATTVTTVTDAENIVVAIIVPGDPSEVSVPTDPETPWIWNWTWTTGTAPVGPDATPVSTPDWNWDWTAPAEGATATATPAAADIPAPTPGQWTWTWIWTRGDGWTTTWTYSQPCSCTWSWVWTWNWPAETGSTASTATPAEIPPPPTNPQVVQTNESSAAAVALTTFEDQQTVVSSTDGDPILATDYQGITSDQTALATADAAQLEPVNLNVVMAGRIDRVSQLNDTAAAASAGTFDKAIQSINQNQLGTGDGALHAIDAAQVIVTTQTATADSQAAQGEAANINLVWSPTPWNQAQIGAVTQKNQAVVASYAAVASETTQTIGQTQIGGGADQLATALQAAVVSQNHQAAAQVAQGNVTNRTDVEIPWNGVWNPPIDQSNEVSAVSVSTAYSGISQTIVQEESGEGIAWDEHAVQTAEVVQSGSASASAEQTRRENFAGWSGVVASDVPAGAGTGATSHAVASAPSSGPSVGPLPQPSGGVLPGRPVTVSFGSSSIAVVHSAPGIAQASHTANSAPAVSAPAAAAPIAAGGGSSVPDQFRHILLNLLGAMSSALALLLGATPFAALLALFTIAALGVGRLQYLAPALGRSADFARRERPG
jgi:hypothetical protein